MSRPSGPVPAPVPVGRRPAARALVRLGAVLVVLVSALLGLAGPAAAHNVLISSDPTDGSTLDTAPQTVTLTFDQPVQNFEPVVVVTGPDGAQYQTGVPTVVGTSVDMALTGLPVAGAYTVAYRVVSADGHPVQGQLVFQLSAAAVSTAPSVPPTSAAVPVDPTSSAPASSTPASSAPASTARSSGGSSGPVSTNSAPTSSAPSSPAPSSPAATSSAAPSPAPASSASTSSAPTSSVAVAPAADGGGLSGWIWAALVVAALLVVAAVVVVVRRPRRPDSPA